jgi:hypothetical protein
MPLSRRNVELVLGGYESEVTIHSSGLLATVFQGQRRLVYFGDAPNNETSEQIWQSLESACSFGYDSIDVKVQKRACHPERTPVVAGKMRQEELSLPILNR